MSSHLSVAELRAKLKSSFSSDPHALYAFFDARVLETPAAAIAALRHYFATVDPKMFNDASRAAFVWAFTLPREPDGHRSTATRLYVTAIFLAKGNHMVAAGDMAPGYNDQFFRLTRSSRHDAWHVDGLYMP